jgi:hypothetical protein
MALVYAPLHAGEQNCPPEREGRSKQNKVRLGFNNGGDHIFEKDFECHGMSTAFVRQEELTVAIECATVKTDAVIIIVTMEGKFEFVKAKPFAVFSVSFSFFQLADQSVVHLKYLLLGFGIKKARENTRAFRGGLLSFFRYLFA